jgi:exodeoxyribonuclease V alpha subunit
VNAFAEAVFNIIEEHPARLQEVDGIGKNRAQQIINSWETQKIVREIMLFLYSHGINTAKAVRIFKTYGNDAIKVMQNNPYRLAKDIRCRRTWYLTP